jgi:RraA family protein
VALELLATSDLADAAGVPIAMHHRIRPAWRGARLAGPAFTVRTPAGEHRAVRESAERAPRGSVIVVDGAGSLERALWGDKMSRLAGNRGVAGIVIDGAVRDVDGIETLQFPVFAAGVTPTPPRRDQTGELDLPVACGDVTVRPGDYVYGDRDGVVVVPSAIHAEVLGRLPSPEGRSG